MSQFGVSLFLGTLAFLFSWVLTRIAIPVGVHWDALDYPTEGKIHPAPVPYTGGPAVALVILVLGWLFAGLDALATLFLLTGFLLGWIDDLRPLPPIQKLGLSFLPLAVWVTSWEHRVGWTLGTLLLSLYLVHAINWMDGLDGLLAGILGIALFGLAVLAWHQRDPESFALAMITLGALLGFLVYNFHPTRIFLGDNGSFFLGFLFLVLLWKMGRDHLSLPGLLFVAVPIANGLLTLGYRLYRRVPVWVRGRDHTYDWMLRRCSYVTTVVSYYALTLATVLLGLGWAIFWQ